MTSRGSCLMVGEGRVRGGRCRSRLVDRSALRLGLMALAEPAIRSSFLIANFVCARRQTDIDWSKCPWVGNIWNENPAGKHKLWASYVSGMHCEKICRGWEWGDNRTVEKRHGEYKNTSFLPFYEQFSKHGVKCSWVSEGHQFFNFANSLALQTSV